MAGELLSTAADAAQIEWRGTVLGDASPWRWLKLEGWFDLPGQRGDNAPLPGFHGSFPGPKSSEPRIVTWTFRATAAAAASAGGFTAAMNQLRRITAPDEHPVEEPLVIRFSGETLLAQARCVRRVIPTEEDYWFDFAEGSIQWEATDPRLYSPTEQTASTPLASGSTSGLDFGSGGLDFSGGGLDFGAPPAGGRLTASNDGHVPTWPVFELVGPVTGPAITYNGHTLRFDPAFVVAAGQTVVIDTRPTWRTVEISDVSVRHFLIVSQWAPFEPGQTQVAFTAASYNAASQLVARWRHAWH